MILYVRTYVNGFIYMKLRTKSATI